MPTVGNTAKPTNSWHSYGPNTHNHEAMALVMPERGRITRLGQWMGGWNDATVRTRLCLWNAGGALVGYTAEFTVNTSSAGGPSGGAWLTPWEADLLVPVIVAAGAGFYVGFARNPADSHQVGEGATDSGNNADWRNDAWPASFAVGPTTGTRRIGAWVANYNRVAAAKVRRAGAWVDASSVQIRRGGAWVEPTGVYVRRGGIWVEAT